MKISDLLDFINTWAPFSTQESWDNCGLLSGDTGGEVNKALLTLDCTVEVVNEAAAEACDLIICHHPPVFHALKRFTSADLDSQVIIAALRRNISILALHTNLDKAPGGVSHEIALRLNLSKISVLKDTEAFMLKLQTFCPHAQSEALRAALFTAGAGNFSDYSQVSFNSSGKGTFTPGTNSKPFSGQPGLYHEEDEVKIECILPEWLESKVVKALLQAHPYEVPAFDVIALRNTGFGYGSGISGYLEKPLPATQFLRYVAGNMKAPFIRHTGIPERLIHKVACCGGSGSFLLPEALAAECDAFITADFKYHQFFEGAGKIFILDIGHYESEQFTPELILRKLSAKFSTFALLLSKVNTNPINYYIDGNNG